ncbi:Sigma factor RpoE negative regulatory protein RseB precursor [Rubrivivax sp. A210]|uniref:MucB/RseB C-terminal domain-containing protein n=1 Tax=Rubrivivax sp. A210 TaxID=2772301 RepID=UPI00191B154C|nr:MucB/RseB C-terminal domain-containing protein [Rubrivivax sp. A210]CAD5370655.1 Sigma factor RpoE negative regulatory protein RseB precursor [Rubrivivax sp. A210]
MRLHLLRGLLCLACTAGLLPAAWAQQGGTVAAQASAPAADARVWLARMQRAASTANYQGTMVFSSGSQLSSSRVWHFRLGEQTFERLEALDGRLQHVLRHNDQVQTIWPQTRVTVLERRETIAGWTTTPQAVDPQAMEQYEVRRQGQSRIAGRDAAVLLLEPRDALRYAQRLWADLASGLMLRADVLGNGMPRPVLESTAYSEVEIGVRPQPELVLGAARRLEGYRVLKPMIQRTTLEAEGWAVVRPVAGFKLAGCVRRGLAPAGGEESVLQAVFTDGLTHVSVFVEPMQPQPNRSESQAQQGATATIATQRGEHWITAVGDVPPATLKLFADALERRRP